MKKDAANAWKAFSKTGAVGAYLTYRAICSQHERGLSPDSDNASPIYTNR